MRARRPTPIDGPGTAAAASPGTAAVRPKRRAHQLTASQAEVADLREQVDVLEKENERLGGASGDNAPASDERPAIFRESAELVVVEDGSETLAACEEQTLLMDDAIAVRDVREGTRLCGVTSEDRPVSVGVVKVSDESVTLEVWVWE